MIFEMVNGLEIYVIYCVALVEVVICYLRLDVACVSDFEALNGYELISNADDSSILTLLFGSGSTIGRPSDLHLLTRCNCLSEPESIVTSIILASLQYSDRLSKTHKSLLFAKAQSS
jgi:hypothetical protein